MSKPLAAYATERNGRPVACSRAAWLAWFGTAKTRVDKTEIAEKVHVITEFSGINVAGANPPEWYETRVNGTLCTFRSCNATRQLAITRHRQLVDQMRSPT